MTEEEKKTITREKHPGRVAQGHKLAALMKKRKEEILGSKEQSTEQSTEQSSVQSTEQPSVQPIEQASVQSIVQPSLQSTEQTSVQSTVQPSVQSNDTYVYGVGMLAVLAIGVCIFFAYNSFPKNKKQTNEKNKINHQNDVLCFRSDDEKTYIING